MLDQLLKTGVQLTQMVGLVGLLWGALAVFGSLVGGRGPFDLLKGAALIAVAVYLIGIGQGL